MIDNMEVNNHDLWIMLLSTVRYSIGRKTYMTSLSWELVLKYAESLNDGQLRQIEREIVQEVRHNKKLNDRKTWIRGAFAISRARKDIKKGLKVNGKFPIY